jgi:putative heme transporter
VDAALTALLTGYGATSSQALAADLVWRAATYVPQVLLGVLAFLWWRGHGRPPQGSGYPA